MSRLVMLVGLLALVISACGGGEEELSFKPRPIPSEYQGLSIEELRAESKGLVYDDLIKGGGTDWRTDPTVEEDLKKYEGELVLFDGLIDTVFESSEPGAYQLWMCADIKTEERRVGTWCDEPVFFLYSLDRGPEIKKDDFAQIAGIVVGSYKRSVRQALNGGQGTTRIITPMVSVIKAELLTESE